MTTPIKKSFEEAYAEIHEDLKQSLGITKPKRFSVASIVARALAPQVSLTYLFIDALARAILPDAAVGVILERWCAIYGIFRKLASFSQGIVLFDGVDGSIIPVGSRLQDISGLEFVTQESTQIVDGTALVSVISVGQGRDYNIASGSELTLISPVAGITSLASVDQNGFSGGSDIESDSNLRERLLFRLRNPPQGGAAHDYISWSLEIPGITRAWVYKQYQGPGSVGVTFVLDAESNIIPNEDSKPFLDLKANLEQKAPLTADVILFPPIPKVVNPRIKLIPDIDDVRKEVREELSDLFFREAEAGGAYKADGTILVSKIREAISTAEGEQDHILESPTSNITVGRGEIAILGDILWL